MKCLLIVVLAALPHFALAEKKAITDTGDEVILYDDGTWKYAVEQATKTTFELNKEIFKKSATSTFMLKSTRNKSAVWLNTDKWSFTKSQDGSAAEYRLKLKQGDLYAMAINEGVEIPLENLVNIAFANAKSASGDIRIVRQEYRTVNGIKMAYAEMTGTLQGIKFTYFGAYYSGPSGSTQLVAYTANNLIAKYRADINEILSGFDLQR